MTEETSRLFARLAVAGGFLQPAQAEALLRETGSGSGAPAGMEPVVELAVRKGFMTREEAERVRLSALYAGIESADRRFGAVALRLGLLPEGELRTRLEFKREEFLAEGRLPKPLGELLREEGRLTADQVGAVEEEAERLRLVEGTPFAQGDLEPAAYPVLGALPNAPPLAAPTTPAAGTARPPAAWGAPPVSAATPPRPSPGFAGALSDERTLIAPLSAPSVPAARGAAGASGRLVQEAGPGTGQVFYLGLSAVLGRQVDCEVPVPDQLASRRHSFIQYYPQSRQHVVSDLKSSNGTFVNEEPLQAPRPLLAGHRIRIGECIFRFEPGSGIVEARIESGETVASLGPSGSGAGHLAPPSMPGRGPAPAPQPAFAPLPQPAIEPAATMDFPRPQEPFVPAPPDPASAPNTTYEDFSNLEVPATAPPMPAPTPFPGPEVLAALPAPTPSPTPAPAQEPSPLPYVPPPTVWNAQTQRVRRSAPPGPAPAEAPGALPPQFSPEVTQGARDLLSRLTGLHLQRLYVVVAAGLGSLGTFLSWDGGGAAGAPIRTGVPGWLVFLLFSLSLTSALLRDVRLTLTREHARGVIAPALIALALGLWEIARRWFVFGQGDTPIALAPDALEAVGKGLYLIIGAGLAIPVLVGYLGGQEGALADRARQGQGWRME
ncbi:MAG: FHA domain-containing protein [Planctomycetes bacterium]|nr:FHA domain-containing protein [Planctomycetota bacterium]